MLGVSVQLPKYLILSEMAQYTQDTHVGVELWSPEFFWIIGKRPAGDP